MATNTLPASVSPFAQMPAATKIKAGAGVIALGAVAVSAWLWSQQPDWQVVGVGAGGDDVRCVAAPCPLGMEGVDHAVAYGAQRVFQKTAFVERVGVDGDLHVFI